MTRVQGELRCENVITMVSNQDHMFRLRASGTVLKEAVSQGGQWNENMKHTSVEAVQPSGKVQSLGSRPSMIIG